MYPYSTFYADFKNMLIFFVSYTVPEISMNGEKIKSFDHIFQAKGKSKTQN